MNCDQRLFPVVLSCCVISWLSCATQPTEPNFQERLVVNSFLKVGAGIDSVFVSRTVPIDQSFDQAVSRVSGAQVRVRRQGGRWMSLSEYPHGGSTPSGVYYLPPDSLRVESGVAYEIEVEALGQRASAQTTAPPQLEILEINRGLRYGERPLFNSGDTVEYVSGKSFADTPYFTMFWQAVPNVTLYRVIADADDGSFENLIRDTTTAAEIFKGKLNEREEPFAFDIAYDPARLPMYARVVWIYFNYYGWHTMRLLATDSVYTRYNIGQFNENEIREMPRSNIQGGFGVFASYSERNFRVYVKKGPLSEP